MKRAKGSEVDGVTITPYYSGLGVDEFIVGEKAYDVPFSSSHEDVDKPCHLCGSEKNVQAPRLDSLYHEVCESQTTVPVFLTEEKNKDFARKLIKAVRKQLIEMDPHICNVCLAKSDDAEGLRAEILDSGRQ